MTLRQVWSTWIRRGGTKKSRIAYERKNGVFLDLELVMEDFGIGDLISESFADPQHVVN